MGSLDDTCQILSDCDLTTDMTVDGKEIRMDSPTWIHTQTPKNNFELVVWILKVVLAQHNVDKPTWILDDQNVWGKSGGQREVLE